jgi:hypothetical protein
LSTSKLSIYARSRFPIWYIPLKRDARGAARFSSALKASLANVPTWDKQSFATGGSSDPYVSTKSLVESQSVLRKAIDACAPIYEILDDAALAFAAEEVSRTGVVNIRRWLKSGERAREFAPKKRGKMKKTRINWMATHRINLHFVPKVLGFGHLAPLHKGSFAEGDGFVAARGKLRRGARKIFRARGVKKTTHVWMKREMGFFDSFFAKNLRPKNVHVPLRRSMKPFLSFSDCCVPKEVFDHSAGRTSSGAL